MKFAKVIIGVLFTTILFPQADKGRELSGSIPQKFDDGFVLEPEKDQPQFQNQFYSAEIVHNPKFRDRNIYSRKNGFSEDDIIFEQGITIPARQYNLNHTTQDTFSYLPPASWHWYGQFIMYPGDAMVTVYQMPTDGILKGVNVPVYEWGTSDQQLTVSLHKMSYPYTTDGTMYLPSDVDGDGWIGGYDMDSTTGWMSIEGATYTTGGTQGVCDTSDFVVAGARDPLGTEPAVSGPPGTPLMGLLWPDDSTAAIMTPSTHPDFAVGGNEANWIDLADYGSEVNLLKGEWVGILVASSGPNNDDPTGFWYHSGYGIVDSWVSTKFYGGCGGTSRNGGWHIRSWIFNFQLAVELTGDRGPIFESISELPTTLSTEPRRITAHITDDNPGGGESGVIFSRIYYQIGSLMAPLDSVEMSLVSGDAEEGIWEGFLPGIDPCDFISWYLEATDINGNSSRSTARSYFIFCPSETNNLIFNNQDPLYGNILYSSYLYFYWGGKEFDVWDASYGGLTDQLLQYYDVLIELTGNGGPFYNNDDKIKKWWDGNKTYIVAGDEWLGSRSGWVNGTTEDGSVTKSILGIDYEYNDINYGSSGDQNSISRLIPDSAGFASLLYEFLSDSLLLNYVPYPLHKNWLDGVDPIDGYVVDMIAYSGVLDSANQVEPPIGSEEYNVMIHGQAGNGGKSAFLAFDPISLYTMPSSYWINVSADTNGNGSAVSPLVQAFESLTAILSVSDDIVIPKAVTLKGNYPNPFNPVTHIQFELTKNAHVTLTIYDLLGREVKKLVSGELPVRRGGVSVYHEVVWDGTNDLGYPVSAGVYLYRINVGDYGQTRKMILIK